MTASILPRLCLAAELGSMTLRIQAEVDKSGKETFGTFIYDQAKGYKCIRIVGVILLLWSLKNCSREWSK